MPLAVCPALTNTSLIEIDQCNRDFKETGRIEQPFQEIGLEIQLHLMKSWIWSVVERVAAVEGSC